MCWASAMVATMGLPFIEDDGICLSIVAFFSSDWFICFIAFEVVASLESMLLIRLGVFIIDSGWEFLILDL